MQAFWRRRWFRMVGVVGFVLLASGLLGLDSRLRGAWMSGEMSRESTNFALNPALETGSRGVRVAAHRGGDPRLPENSLAAFHQSIQSGMPFLELDVHLTRDGVPVILHDPTLDRTTGGQGPVHALLAADAARLALRDAEGSLTDQTLPTLDALLSTLDDRVQLLLEVKHQADGSRYPGMEEALLALLSRHNVKSRTIVMSFDLTVLEHLRALDSSVKLGGLIGYSELQKGQTVEDFLDALSDLRASFAGVHWRIVHDGLAQQTHARGLLLGAWTVNNINAVQPMASAGVDVIITDHAVSVTQALRNNVRERG